MLARDAPSLGLAHKTMLPNGGPVRIACAEPVAPYRWKELKEVASIPTKVAMGLYSTAIKLGSRPGEWRGTLDLVPPEKFLAVERYDGEQWIPFSAEELKAAECTGHETTASGSREGTGDVNQSVRFCKTRPQTSKGLLDRVQTGNYTVRTEVLTDASQLGNKKRVAESLTRTVPVDIQNVYEWMKTDWLPKVQAQDDGANLGQRHFGELRPSFVSMWFEWKCDAGSMRAVWAISENSLWRMLLIEEDGNAACITHNWVVDLEREPLAFGYPANFTSDDKELAKETNVLILLTQSLLLCKNVQILKHPRAAGAEKRFRRKHGGHSPANYRSVVIEPMKKVIRNAGRLKGPGVEKAMHMVRGHFRDYSRERPLFGKFAGRLFVQSHVRGNGKLGVKPPGYQVLSPKERVT